MGSGNGQKAIRQVEPYEIAILSTRDDKKQPKRETMAWTVAIAVVVVRSHPKHFGDKADRIYC